MASDVSSDDNQANHKRIFEILMVLNEGLEPFTQTEINNLHLELRSQIHTSGSCGECLKTDKETQWRVDKFKCRNGICDKWLSKLKDYHTQDRENIALKNVVISKLPTSALECAKVFFNHVDDDIVIEDFGDIDIAAKLRLYMDCMFFQDKVNISACKKVRKIRNRIMHPTSRKKIDVIKMKIYITTIIGFLQDTTLISDQGCMRAVEKIKQLLSGSHQSTRNVQMESMMGYCVQLGIENKTEINRLTKMIEEDRSNTPERSGKGHSRVEEDEEERIRSSYKPSLDGRICDLSKNAIITMIEMATILTEGTTYLFPGFNNDDRRLVIKKIVCKNKRDKLSALQKMLETRLKHQGIVPLFAGTWDEQMETYYFVMPFLERGDLHTALKEDRQRDLEGEDPILTKEIRRRILFQLALLLQFFLKHRYRHGAIITKNIVLDVQFNMRLLDLGLSQNIADQSDIAGYRPRNTPDEITENTDIFSYGVVVLEVMTGQPPINDDVMYLHEISWSQPKHVEHIWDNLYPHDLDSIAKKCKSNSSAQATIKFAIDKLEKELGEKTKFRQIQDNTPKCNLCMKNHTVDTRILKHESCDVRLCVACIRSSHPDRIQCPLCQKDILSPIGIGWGAIFIAGNDTKDPVTARGFRKAVSRIKRTMTSRRQLAMGLRVEDVFVVQPRGPDRLKDVLEEAINSCNTREHIHTLILYFNGHGNDTNQLILADSKETINDDWLIKTVLQGNSRIKTLVILIDCCYPNQSLDIPYLLQNRTKVIRFTVCNSDEESLSKKNYGGYFTDALVNCLAGRNAHELCRKSWNSRENCKICTNEQLLRKCDDGFISFEYCEEYIDKHMEKVDFGEPVFTKVGAKWHESKLAFCLPEVSIEILSEKESYQLNELDLPDKMDELMDLLFDKAKHTLADSRRKHFMDIYSIVKITGPHRYDTRELLNVEEIERAIKALHRIYIVPRVIKDIGHQKYVGIFLDKEEFDSQAVIDCIKCVWKLEPNKKDNRLEVAISLNAPSKMKRKPQCPNEHKQTFYFLSKILDVVKTLNQNVKLLLSFPYNTDSRTDVETKFFSIRLCN